MPIKLTLANYHHGTRGISLMRPSPLSNRFEWRQGLLAGADGALIPARSRTDALQQYALWLRLQMASETAAMAELTRLLHLARRAPITLLCGCTPAPCHLLLVEQALAWLDKQPRYVPGVSPVPRLRYTPPPRAQGDLFGG